MTEVGPVAYDALRRFLVREVAIELGPDRQYLVSSRLRTLAVRRGCASVDDLIFSLQSGRRGDLAQSVIDAMVTNETFFFRDRAVFDALLTSVLPQLFEKRRGESIRIWSAASASGQEAFSLAMLVLDRLPNLAKRLSILATDVSIEMVERVRKGWFSQLEVSRGLPPNYRRMFFEASGDGFQLRSDVHSLVRPEVLNLIRPWPNIGPFDLVFLRNVLIYFPQQYKREVVAQLERKLLPGSVVLLGTGETMLGLSERFETLRLPQAQLHRLLP